MHYSVYLTAGRGVDIAWPAACSVNERASPMVRSLSIIVYLAWPTALQPNKSLLVALSLSKLPAPILVQTSSEEIETSKQEDREENWEGRLGEPA